MLEACPPPAQAMIGWNTRVDRSETNLAKVLKSLGYVTGFVGKWHTGEPAVDLSAIKGITDPADPTFAAAVKAAYDERVNYLRNGFGFDCVDRVYFGNREGFPGPLQVHNLEWLCEGAERFVQTYYDRPFFLYLALSTPHGDHFTSFLDDDPLRTPAGLLKAPPRTLMPPRKGIPERLKKAGVSPTTAMSTWQDDCVGAVLARLAEAGPGGQHGGHLHRRSPGTRQIHVLRGLPGTVYDPLAPGIRHEAASRRAVREYRPGGNPDGIGRQLSAGQTIRRMARVSHRCC